MFSPPNSRGVAPNHTVRPSGGVGRNLNARMSDLINAKDFGATGNGATDDTVAIQAAINAAQHAGGTALYVPAGIYKITNTVTVSKHIKLIGAGPQGLGDTAGAFYANGPINSLTTANAGTAFACSSNVSFLNITTPDACVLQDFMIYYPTPAGNATGVTAVNFNISSAHSNVGSVVSNLTIAGPDRGIQTANCFSMVVRDCYFWDHWTYGIATFTNGTDFLSPGDWTVTGCTFASGSTSQCIHAYLQSTGGPRFINNKFNTGGSVNNSEAIQINPSRPNTFIEPVIIVGNSFEGTRIGIHLTGASTTNSGSTQGVISGNQIWASNSSATGITGSCIRADTATGTPYSGWAVNGNFFQVDGGGSSAQHIFLANCQYWNVNGNTFTSGSGAATALTIDGTSTSCSGSANLKGANVI
jgi:Pectate lyase superfamily protein